MRTGAFFFVSHGHPHHGVAMAIFLGFLLLNPWAAAQNPQQQKSAQPATKQSSSNGRQLFEATCSGCHGLDGRGGERGPDISTRPQIVQLSDAELFSILRVGKPASGMPPFDSLGTANLNSLLAFLRSLQGKGAAAALPGDPAKGKALFFERARCSECHMLHGTGGFLGRDLSNYGAGLSAAEIRASLLRPGNDMSLANKTAVITLRDLRKFTGIIRNQDNFSIQLQSLDGAFHFLARSDVAQVAFLPQPVMPADYATTLTPAQLDDLVSYLLAAANDAKTTKPSDQADDNE